MKFHIEYKEPEVKPIRKVIFRTKYGSECLLTIDEEDKEIIFQTNACSNFTHFRPQDAIELGEMLIKLGKQELKGE